MLSLFNTGYGLQDQLDGVKNGIAIVATGNTHAAITSGQYVYIQDHGTLAEGLYRATANIAANGTLSGSNVTAVSGGGLNALNSKIPKYYQGQLQSDTIATNSNGNIIISNPSGATTIKAIIPFGYVPSDHWKCGCVFTTIDVSTRTIYFRAVGEGASQKYTIMYLVIYE